LFPQICAWMLVSGGKFLPDTVTRSPTDAVGGETRICGGGAAPDGAVASAKRPVPQTAATAATLA
jgi:hypothetical protein